MIFSYLDHSTFLLNLQLLRLFLILISPQILGLITIFVGMPILPLRYCSIGLFTTIFYYAELHKRIFTTILNAVKNYVLRRKILKFYNTVLNDELSK